MTQARTRSVGKSDVPSYEVVMRMLFKRELGMSQVECFHVDYAKPFDLLVRGNDTREWRGRRDSNPKK